MIIDGTHCIEGGLYRASPNNSGPFAAPPTLIVMHYTAGGSGKGSADWLCRPDAGASAHIVVDRDGTFYQIVPFNIRAWHAGESSWKGRKSCNGYSIGIEIANFGYDTTRNVQIEKIIQAAHKEGGPVRSWERYDAAQLDAVEALTRALIEKYPTLTDIAGHDDIAPLRKQDPGPVFPMERFVALLGQSAPVEPVPPRSAPGILRILRAGDAGDDVKALKRALNSQNGAMLDADDNAFDGLTFLAVKYFQTARGLEQDGIAGPITLKALGLWPS